MPSKAIVAQRYFPGHLVPQRSGAVICLVPMVTEQGINVTRSVFLHGGSPCGTSEMAQNGSYVMRNTEQNFGIACALAPQSTRRTPKRQLS